MNVSFPSHITAFALPSVLKSLSTLWLWFLTTANRYLSPKDLRFIHFVSKIRQLHLYAYSVTSSLTDARTFLKVSIWSKAFALKMVRHQPQICCIIDLVVLLHFKFHDDSKDRTCLIGKKTASFPSIFSPMWTHFATSALPTGD